MIDVIIFYTLNKIRVTFSLHYVNFCFKFKLIKDDSTGSQYFKFQYMSHTEQNKNSLVQFLYRSDSLVRFALTRR